MLIRYTILFTTMSLLDASIYTKMHYTDTLRRLDTSNFGYYGFKIFSFLVSLVCSAISNTNLHEYGFKFNKGKCVKSPTKWLKEKIVITFVYSFSSPWLVGTPGRFHVIAAFADWAYVLAVFPQLLLKSFKLYLPFAVACWWAFDLRCLKRFLSLQQLHFAVVFAVIAHSPSNNMLGFLTQEDSNTFGLFTLIRKHHMRLMFS